MTDDPRKISLLMSLRAGGVRDRRVLEAIETVPRELFVEKTFADQAYADQPLPIDCGQTISQPFIVGFMTDRLEVKDRHTVLEIGTGSGYQAAILSKLCRRVVTIERYRTLAKQAEERFKTLKLSNVTQIVGDGSKGWPQLAPFERIIVTAAAKELPQALVDQLAVGGVMVLPIEERPGKQDLYRIRKTEDGVVQEHLLPVRFVPLVEGLARDG
ncbi:MAG: protein-L-isoaspartate(D-aspartate) O-methyltransferase [Alphaproteobacteria bacterium]|nr:protein-L-isoaspartate(D-aspartate) O-methyltransferase [Alphaproteobacteria bacterium]